MSTALITRATKSAEILKVPTDQLMIALSEEGITNDAAGIAILDAVTTEISDLVDILNKVSREAKILQIKAAAAVLKDSETRQAPQAAPAIESSFTAAMKAQRPIEQWSDREVLEKYSTERDPLSEQELSKRAKNQGFVILAGKGASEGKEVIDIEQTLELLKNARKRVNPSFIPGPDSTVLPVYRISELNMQDRIVELCPICGDAMYKGFCDKCQLNFGNVGPDERAYVKLIVDKTGFDPRSLSDRKAVHASASKGLSDLRLTWPCTAYLFDELKLTNDLPRLRIMSSKPSSVADPFFNNGSRAFGNRQY